MESITPLPAKHQARIRRPDPLLLPFLLALLAFVFAPQAVALARSPLLPLSGHADLGARRPGEQVRRQFVVANLSLRTVKVLSVNAGCGCVAGLSGSASLPPFAIRTIHTAMRVPQTGASLHREIFVEVDDPRRPYLALTLDGRIIPDTRSRGPF